MKVTMELSREENRLGTVYVNDAAIQHVSRVENIDIVDWFYNPYDDNEEIKKTWCYCDGVRLLDYKGEITLRILPTGYIEYMGDNI